MDGLGFCGVGMLQAGRSQITPLCFCKVAIQIKLFFVVATDFAGVAACRAGAAHPRRQKLREMPPPGASAPAFAATSQPQRMVLAVPFGVETTYAAGGLFNLSAG